MTMRLRQPYYAKCFVQLKTCLRSCGTIYKLVVWGEDLSIRRLRGTRRKPGPETVEESQTRGRLPLI